MENIRANTLIINGKTADASGYTPEPSADLYYEVIRVIGGKYLFLEDHLQRLETSCNSHIPAVPERHSIEAQLRLLVNATEINTGNVKLIIYNVSGQTNMVSFFISHFYPADEDYQMGVCVKTFRFERPDPNIKRWNELFRIRVNQFIRDETIYEALLVNEQGILTEGSRSNLFFINGENSLLTAPLELVLPGITRKYVLQICDELGITVIEQAVSLVELNAMSGCFITGTSPKVLPVHQLNEIKYNAGHPLIQKIGATFNKLVHVSLS